MEAHFGAQKENLSVCGHDSVPSYRSFVGISRDAVSHHSCCDMCLRMITVLIEYSLESRNNRPKQIFTGKLSLLRSEREMIGFVAHCKENSE
ncbi:hypothetical protein AVEN_144497-1 [Araneus ventricosus]|uniref:Uncharacterized protein n=1 Tax=Araneus ventricosus TaxID=182803 RepID=A0A4Y2VRA6_ARAVE|nr:hypothetical protein AVEN_144497-1 [Araneus ventricosus]